MRSSICPPIRSIDFAHALARRVVDVVGCAAAAQVHALQLVLESQSIWARCGIAGHVAVGIVVIRFGDSPTAVLLSRLFFLAGSIRLGSL